MALDYYERASVHQYDNIPSSYVEYETSLHNNVSNEHCRVLTILVLLQQLHESSSSTKDFNH